MALKRGIKKTKNVVKNLIHKSDERSGVAGFVLGITFLVTILGLFLPFLFIAIPIVGLIYSIRQQKIKKTNFGKWGIVLNIIGILLIILLVIFFVAYLVPLANQINSGSQFPVN